MTGIEHYPKFAKIGIYNSAEYISVNIASMSIKQPKRNSIHNIDDIYIQKHKYTCIHASAYVYHQNDVKNN